MRSRRILAALVAACVLLPAAPTLQAQSPSPSPALGAKRPITHDVYDSWRSIQGTVLTRDGAWLAYALVPQDGDGALVVRNLRTGAERRHPRGKDPAFTADGRFVAFTITALKEEVDKAKKAGKKDDELPKNGFGVLNIETGQVFTADRVKSFKLADEGSAAVAYLLEAPEKKDAEKTDETATSARERERPGRKKEKKKDPGTDLVVRELASGASATIPDVVEYGWNKDGSSLAYTVSSKTGERDGAFVRQAQGGTTIPLITGKGFYKGIAFDEKGTQLAFVSDRDEHAPDPAVAKFKLYHWTAGSTAAREAASATISGMPTGFSVSEHGKVSFTKDGGAVFFGMAPVPPRVPDDAPEPVKVDIWHYRDPLLQSMQKTRAEEEQKRSYLAVVHLKDGRFVPLGSPELPELTVTEGANTLLGVSDVPYRRLISWDGDYNDYYIVNLREGTKQRLIEKAAFDARLSPGGSFVLYYDDREHDWISVQVSDGRRVNLTEKLGPSFEDEDWDTPGAPRPYGTAGWFDGDRAVLLYDRYDIWEIKPDGGGARQLTRGAGRAQKIVFRYQRLDADEKTIPSGTPLLLTATDERTKASGVYRIAAGGTAPPEKLLVLDKAFGNLRKAKNADVFVFTLSRFEEFPDLWVSGPRFTDLKKISDANPQQAEFVWGRAELMDYINADGKPLRATLIRPENFDPSKKYPLMAYIYETLTEGLHRYTAPAPGTSVNVTRYVSNGYVVLMPDIIYETGYPGQSAYKCVIPAVQALVAKGYIDPARIGIQGHSWGGYQITYLITRTNMFRAVEAGASVANMISAYGGIRWGTGMSRAFQYEKTQSRIGAPPWDNTLEFIENSPIFWVEKIQTPYLTVHNDDDDAVPWYQGIEFFTAMRRLGKEAYFFNYNGEKHGLRQRENQKHWTVHMAEFFDHYLLGAPRPEWMDKGVPYLERGTRDVSGMFRRKTTDR
ncbi:MAG TPA: prolyl oligopeptidase family serine peptidase [Vicinamibacterales bacterium]|nr:prolyl oligopeptidase family serine peptidase [Vicinamibacterales bacterium]